MNKIAASVVEKKVKETASAISEAAEEMLTMSRRTHTLEILVALLGGIVVGAKAPIVLTSRGSTAEEKFYSIAVAVLVAEGSRA